MKPINLYRMVDINHDEKTCLLLHTIEFIDDEDLKIFSSVSKTNLLKAKKHIEEGYEIGIIEEWDLYPLEDDYKCVLIP